MKRSIRLGHLLAAGAVAALATAGPVEHVVQAKPTEPSVPSTIEVPDGHQVFLATRAVGVQIYSCNATASGFSWSLVAPRADLYNEHGRGKPIGTHYGGPTWQAKDGSAVVARRVDGVTVDPTAIPWLLLSTVSTTAGPDGDRLTKTAFIQRTNTAGGLPPAAADCNSATTGATVEVPYTADYHFWKATGR